MSPQQPPSQNGETDGSGATKKKKRKSVGSARRAGLILPPSLVMKFLRSRKMRVAPGAAVAAASAVEYVLAEVSELAASRERGSRTKSQTGKGEGVRVSLKALSSAVRSDKELNALLGGVALATGRAFRRSHPGELGMLHQ